MQQQQLSIDSLRGHTGSGASLCSGVMGNTIVKWDGSSLCNSSISDNGSNLGIGGVASAAYLNVLNNDVTNYSRGRAAQFYTSLPGNSSNNFGTVILAEGSTAENIGIQVGANNAGGSVATTNWGIQASATGASGRNFAGAFVADQPTDLPGSTSYAIYAQTTGHADVNYGLYAKAVNAPTNYAGWFDGDVNVNGSYFQNGSSFTSDQTFKTNIDSFAASSIIKNLKPRTFYFDTTNVYGMSFSNQKQYGLIAQDVQTVLPELVSTFNKPVDIDKDGTVLHPAKTYKTLNYNAFISILIKNAQEQQKTIDSLKKSLSNKDSVQDARLAALEAAVNTCCSISTARTTNVNVQSTELSDAAIVVLNQNQPNPFAEQTSITYNIPQSAGAAQILFYDVNGKQIQNVAITTKGKGQLNVYANDLTNGVYSYTLIVDGKIIDTKKMVKQQ